LRRPVLKRLIPFYIAAMLMSAFALTIAPATAAQASCRGAYVLNSLPLTSTATGQSSWGWGYVQLWYNDCTGKNYGRVVSNLAGTTSETILIYNDAMPPQWNSGGASYSGTEQTPVAYQGPFLPSPNNAAGTVGEVDVNHANTFYYAEVDQSGASCASDFPVLGDCG